jgi:hypothetical protein
MMVNQAVITSQVMIMHSRSLLTGPLSSEGRRPGVRDCMITWIGHQGPSSHPGSAGLNRAQPGSAGLNRVTRFPPPPFAAAFAAAFAGASRSRDTGVPEMSDTLIT